MRINRRDWIRTSLALPQLMAAARQPQLKIKRVDPYVLKFGNRGGYVCCSVETEDGVHGWGEGTTPPNVTPVVAQIRSLGKLIQGEPVWDIERLWRKMYITEENSLGGTLFAAMSAIGVATCTTASAARRSPPFRSPSR